MDMTDKELALEIALRQTQIALFQTQERACRSEVQLASMGFREASYELQALAAEQKKRAEVKPEAPASEATPE